MLRALLGRPSGSRRDPLGPRGERVAGRALKRKGYRVLERNAMTGVGEADLVCLGPDRRTLVIVEVKARRVVSIDAPGFMPEANVNPRKRRKLIRVAQSIARTRRMEMSPLRIDVVAVEFAPKGAPRVRHHENAVTL